jgi:hypothetical protein
MGVTMSSNNISVNRVRGALFDWAVDAVQRAYQNYRGLGLKAEHSFAQVALDFDLSAPRAKQIGHRDNLWSMCVGEVEQIWTNLDRHEERIATRLEERREALRTQRRQLMLGFQCATDSVDGSGLSSGGSGNGETNAKAEAARGQYLAVARRRAA